MYKVPLVFLCIDSRARSDTYGVDNSVTQVALLSVSIILPTTKPDKTPITPSK